jgi:hypothetical protein
MLPNGTAGSEKLEAEEYELQEDPQPEAGPSRPRRASKSKRSSISRTITLNPSLSTHHLLFDAPPLAGSSTKRRRNSSNPTPYSPVIPRRQFLHEDVIDLGHGEEQVQLPDFGQMLGFNPDAGEDHFGVAQGMKTRWKRQLYYTYSCNRGNTLQVSFKVISGRVIG